MHASLARLVSRRRRLIAALFTAAAVTFTIAAVRPGVPDGVSVVAAARDLPGGTKLRPADVTRVTLPSAAVPAGAIRRGVSGRVLAGPVRRGEPLTDVRFVSSGLPGGYGPTTVATPVRIADAATVRLLRAGERVDVLATQSRAAAAGRARVIAPAVPVITVPRPASALGGDEGAIVLLATSRAQATLLAGAAVDSRLSVTLVGHW